MHPLDRVVAGLACREVLAELSAYLDGELPSARREALEAHLHACDTCTRFGGRVAGVVTALRASLRDEAADAAAVTRALARWRDGGTARLAPPGA
ncbi:MAG: zf-HC2 domain-containing protein [Gemmatimonadales bacterium]|nr:zf-HC2 domain-containing protein [Gemmatimonadales bacterium]